MPWLTQQMPVRCFSSFWQEQPRLKKVKVCLLSSSLDHSKRFTLFCPWQTCSFRHQLSFSSKHSSHAAITRISSVTHMSTTVYSQILIYTAECWVVVEKTKMPKLRLPPTWGMPLHSANKYRYTEQKSCYHSRQESCHRTKHESCHHTK